MRISLRAVLIGLIALVGVVGLVQVVPSASPQPSPSATVIGAQCTKVQPGVSLVVDFGDRANKAALVLCARGFNAPNSSVSNQLNAWQLFAAAGVEVSGTSDYPVGFACRIAGYPTAAEQPCTSTPTYAEGHWAYFYANSAKGWVFSGTGAAQRKPTCGSVEGWLFVSGSDTNGFKAAQTPKPAPEVFSCAP